MLAVAGGAWSQMQAICMASPTNQEGEQEWFAGILQEVAYPCEEGEDCPTCLTVALQTEDRKTYYLTGLDEHGQESLELSYQQFSHPGSFLVAAIQGIPYTSGSFDYIQVSKIWTRCMHSIGCLDNPHIEVSGTLHPKVVQGKGDGFPDCQTVVLETSEREYYLHWSYLSKDLQILLDTMQSPLQVTIKGEEDCACIIVSDIIENHPITSLCDTWNVMETDGVTCGGCETYRTRIYRLHADTIIGEQHYARLLMEGLYAGALREGNNRDIYCIPAGTTHEYLLYAFNAKQGEALSNLWLGGQPSECPDGWTATIDDILETTPRTFVIRAQVSDRFGTYSWNVYWKEGVGLYSGPMGREGCLTCANSRVYDVLCAYKDNEQVYANPSMSSKYGCYYDSNEQQGDTVQLYRRSGDGPGSSTVDPVDPNQIVVILQQDLLIMREYTGEEIQYSLQKSPAKANAPAMSKRVQADSFRGSASLRLTENGTYRLDLTNPEWDYSIYGEFDYGTTDVEPVKPDAAASKVIRNGHLLIQKGDKIYTLTGVEIQ